MTELNQGNFQKNSAASLSEAKGEKENVNELLYAQLVQFDRALLKNQMETLSVLQLVDFLKTSHKHYLTKVLPEIEQSLLHIISKFSESHRLLTGLAYYFNNYKNKLINHIKMEEDMFFPYVEALVDGKENDTLSQTALANFEDNHDSVEDELTEVARVLFDLADGTNAPLPFKVFLNQVSIFELELRKHAFIEDEVLFPKLIALEKELNA